jgi:hypothetical protein
MVVPQSLRALPIQAVNQVPVMFADTPADVRSLVMVPESGPGSPSAASLIPEVNKHRPLVCGLQIQNFDDDTRQGIIGSGFIIVGTLGCFVTRANGNVALLSNNHVVAGHNRGVRGTDRILQAGGGTFVAADQAGVLSDYVALLPSPPGASPALGTAVLNNVDAGIVELGSTNRFTQGYLSSRGRVAPHATASAKVGDSVFKVGRTTGLTHGEVTSIATTVGPVPYDPGPCWFQNSIEIEGVNGTLFSDHGDSGSAIVRDNGEVVGLLYAGNGVQTYACPIDLVLTALSCTLA